MWDDDEPAEPRFRRSQQVASPSGRTLPGMPLEMRDPEDADAPRLRRKKVEKRAPWWRPASTVGRVALAVGVLILVGGVAVSYAMVKTRLERDSRFRIAGASNIQFSGLTEVSRREMLPVFGEDIGKNIFFVHLNERRKQLEQIPWIQHATVMRLLPDQIRVSVVERTPIAFVREGQQIGLVDADGVLLSMPPAMMTQHHYSFPVVTGIDANDPLSSRRARMAVYQRLLAELDSNGQHISEQISEIDLTDPEDARVLMPEQGADILAHFGDDQFLARYQRYKTHIAEWRQQYPKLAGVDLRYDQQVVLEMAPGSGAAQAAVNAGTPPSEPAKPAATEEAKTSPDAKQPELKLTAAPAPPAVKAKAHPKPKVKDYSMAGLKSATAKDKKKRADAAKRAALAKKTNPHAAAANGQGQ